MTERKMLKRVRKHLETKQKHKRTSETHARISLALRENRLKVCSDIDQKRIFVDW